MVFGKHKALTLREALEKILDDMRKADREIEASILLRTDGLIVSASLPAGADADLIAAMLTTILNVSGRVLNELTGGKPEDIVIKGEQKIIAIVGVTEDLLLGTLASKGANLGLLLFEMKRASDKIKKEIEK